MIGSFVFRSCRPVSTLAVVAAALFASSSAFAQSAPTDQPELKNAPPPDAKALVAGPKSTATEPKLDKPDDGTTAGLSAGGLLVTGNSRTMALSGSGMVDTRLGSDGFGASILGNYGQGAPPGKGIVATAQNVQGRLRYDRWVSDRASLFLMLTGRHDRFQGIDGRMNIDPGLKYLFVKEKGTSFWGEGGYDFQYDVRRNDARGVKDADGNPVLDAAGQPVLLEKTRTDHSLRAFTGYKHAFNADVNLTMGIEYLQSVVKTTRWRLNFETLLAAKLAGGISVGLGVSARYDHDPLPTKEELDTSTTLNLIYAFTNIVAPEDKKCPCPPPPPEPPALPPAPPPPASDAPPPAQTAPSTPTTTPANPPPNMSGNPGLSPPLPPPTNPTPPPQ